MTLKDVENIRPPKLSIQEAASIMGVTPLFLQLSLRENNFPFGTAIKGKRWAYYINTERFIRYMKGEDMNVSG